MLRSTRLLATAAVAFGIFSGSAVAETFKISHQWKGQVDARDRAARVFIEEVEKRTDDLDFRIYPGRSLIQNPVAQFDALQDGSVEMTIYPLVYAVGKVPEFSVTIMPGLIRSLDQAISLKDTEYHQKLQEIAHANGVHILTWWWTPGGFATKDREIKGPETVQGLKMRAADPYFEAMLQSAGASVHAMPSSEVYPALQTGVLDGLLTSLETLVSMRIYEQTNYATIGGENELYILIQPLLMAKAAWDKLTPEQQQAFEEAAEVSEEFFHEEQGKSAEAMRKTFEEAGVEVRALTDEEYQEWLALAKDTAWKKFQTEVSRGEELINTVQTATEQTSESTPR